MSKRMKNYIPYLQVVDRSKPKVRKVKIEHGPSDVIVCICECSINVLKVTVPVSASQKRLLSRYKKHLRALANKKISQAKKKLLNQKGGNLLTALLPPVISVFGSLFTK